MRMKTFLLLSGLLWATSTLAGFHLRFEHFTARNGLGDDMIFRIYEHPGTGYLWFGTNIGLVRYNGNSFVTSEDVFPEQTGVLALCEASDRELYIAPYRQGLFRIDALSPFESTHVSDQLIKAIKIQRLSDGRLLCLPSGSNEIFSLDTAGVLESLCYERAMVTDFAVLNDELAYVSTTEGLFNYATTSREREQVFEEGVSFLVEDHGGVLFASGNRIFRHAEGQTEVLQELPYTGQSDNFIKDRNGNLWVGAKGGGLFLCESGDCTDVGALLGNKQLIVQDLHEDREGNVWVATRGHGLYRVNIIQGVEAFDGLGQKTPFFLAGKQLEDGSFLVGGDNVLYACKEGRCADVTLSERDDWLFVYDIKTHENQAWISTNQGVYDYDVLSGAARLISVLPCHSLAIVDGDRVYFAKDNVLFHLRGEELVEVHRSDFRIQRLLESGSQLLFFTEGGVFSYDPSAESVSLKAKAEPRLYNHAVLDSEGSIWCTTNRGVYRLDDNGWFRVPSSRPNGSSRCFGLAIGPQGRIWVGTAQGLDWIDPEEPELKPGHVLAEGPELIIASREGPLVVGTNRHLFRVNTDIDSRLAAAPRILIEAAVAGGDTLENSSFKAPFELSHKRPDLVLDLDVVNLSSASGLVVSYQLHPRMKHPQPLTDQKLILSGLASGSYRLELFAEDPGRNSGRSILELNFSVAKPWWEHPLGAFGLTFLLVSLLTLFAWAILVFQRRRYRGKLNIELLKMRALNNQLNPHFLSNALNSIKHLLSSADASVVSEYVSQFTYLLRKSLARLEQNDITLREEIKLLGAYLNLQQLRFDNRFDYTLSISSDLDPDTCIPFMIVQPFVENALWHGLLPSPEKHRHLSVTFSNGEAKGRIRIRIQDNGVGYRAKKGAKSAETDRLSGIEITRRRLKLIDKHAFIHISSHTTQMEAHERGTTIEIETRSLGQTKKIKK